MKGDFDKLYEGPRYLKRTRRRKIRLIGAIIVALFLFIGIMIAVNIGEDEPKEAVAPLEDENQAEEEIETSEDIIVDSEETEVDSHTFEPDEETAVSSEYENIQTAGENETGLENRDDRTNVNQHEEKEVHVVDIREGSWKPVGTTQQEPHVTSYEKDSVDWAEMIKAIEVATGLTKERMIVWWLGNGGGPALSEGIVTSMDQQEIYRVHLQWIAHEGWMPTKVERLTENPMKKNSEEAED